MRRSSSNVDYKAKDTENRMQEEQRRRAYAYLSRPSTPSEKARAAFRYPAHEVYLNYGKKMEG